MRADECRQLETGALDPPHPEHRLDIKSEPPGVVELWDQHAFEQPRRHAEEIARADLRQTLLDTAKRLQ